MARKNRKLASFIVSYSKERKKTGNEGEEGNTLVIQTLVSSQEKNVSFLLSLRKRKNRCCSPRIAQKSAPLWSLIAPISLIIFLRWNIPV